MSPFMKAVYVAKAVKSRARCTTLEAARASETKFALYFFPFLREVLPFSYLSRLTFSCDTL